MQKFKTISQLRYTLWENEIARGMSFQIDII